MNTQNHLSISDIKDDILLLKDGGGALVLQVSAVNFGLLSQREQIAIIYAFAQMLNSLSFSIQIVILSERLNINSYLTLLDKARAAHTNPLLAQMIGHYRQFVQTTIKENDVLDKKFYIVIPLFNIEVGITSSKEALWQKIKTVLLPRKNQVIRQLSRVGLKATQLDTQKLLELFYGAYNSFPAIPTSQELAQPKLDIKLNSPRRIQPTLTSIPRTDIQPIQKPVIDQPIQQVGRQAKNHPFVVEELSDSV